MRIQQTGCLAKQNFVAIKRMFAMLCPILMGDSNPKNKQKQKAQQIWRPEETRSVVISREEEIGLYSPASLGQAVTPKEKSSRAA